tara:strand:+ start:386 stop:616 length:231 start_codon:yes stop_codon:yes gene_type:complete
MGKAHKKIEISPGDIMNWLDEGPAIILHQAEILDPIPFEDYAEYSENINAWPREVGWKIKLLKTGETLDVHENTLE